jgi:hypothetical protein
MGRKRSSNPAAILSISLPLTTRAKLDAYNPRNRSAFVNQAILEHIKRNDPSTDFGEVSADESAILSALTERRVAAILLNRLQARDAPADVQEAVLGLLMSNPRGDA